MLTLNHPTLLHSPKCPFVQRRQIQVGQNIKKKSYIDSEQWLAARKGVVGGGDTLKKCRHI